jgi:hypothetical protein
VLAYAAEHDFSKGDSPEYIFEGGTGCLKVYVGQPRAGLQPGYHLVAYGFGDEAHTFSDAGVVIVWQPFPELGGQAPVYSRDRAWDAEYTHGWLMGTLFPAVLNWLRTQERRQVSPFSRWRERLTRTLSGSRSREVQISEVAISCARTPRAWVALQFGTRDEALQLVRGLQAHFNGYDCLAPLEVSLERRVLDLVLYLLSGTERDDERYIRGKLDIEAGKSLSQGLQALIAKRTAGTVTGWGLDMALRSLIAALETAPELELARLDYVARQLEPLWKRWREDLLCWAYC